MTRSSKRFSEGFVNAARCCVDGLFAAEFCNFRVFETHFENGHTKYAESMAFSNDPDFSPAHSCRVPCFPSP